jgi:hypothetical protein
MQDLYPNLPGILAEFKDGGLALRQDPNPPATDSILLLGTAIDGPILEPVAVDAATVELLFGKAINPNGTPNGSTLVKAFEQAYAAGSRDIRVMRVTGEKALGSIKGASTTFNNDKAHSEVLGAAPGNVDSTFKLNQAIIDTASVQLQAGGVDLVATQYSVTQGTAESAPGAGDAVMATVTLFADNVDAGTEVFITYSYVDNGSTITVRENAFLNAGVAEYYVAEGADQAFPLAHVPKAGSENLYANGVLLPGTAFDIVAATKELVLHPGFAQLGDTLELSYLYIESVTEEPVIKIESVYGGYLYNETTAEVKNLTNAGGSVIGKQVVFTKPASKKAQINEAAITLSSIDFPTFGLFVQAVNSHPINNVVRLTTAKRFENISLNSLQVQPATNLTGGDNGVSVSKQALFEALGGVRDINGYIVEPGAYQLLENYTVDTVVPIGVFADDELPGKYDNFAYQLALACAVMSHRGSATLGIISTSTPEETGLKAVDEHVKHLLSLNMDFFMKDRQGNDILDSQGKKIDLGRYISVLAGPDLVLGSGRFGMYAANSPAVYAGMVSTMPVQSAPTNKQVPSALGLRFNFSNSQLDALTAKRFVTFKGKRNGEVVAVTDAMTAAQADSDYRRLVTYRVVKEAVNEVRDVTDPYIGEPNEVQQRNAMSAAISKRLDKMKENGAIVDYDFQVIATPEMQLLGQAQIELTIVPPMELRQVTVVVSLRATL